MDQSAPSTLKHPISRQLHQGRSFGERLADNAADQIGSWRFLIIQSIAVALWIIFNIVAILKSWDPYPFVLLNLLFSVQAAYTGPVLLLSSNRSSQRDRVMAEHDYATNEKAEKIIESLMSELLRNSQATLAIAKHLDVHVEDMIQRGSDLDTRMATVQDQLAEVEDALAAEKAIHAAMEVGESS